MHQSGTTAAVGGVSLSIQWHATFLVYDCVTAQSTQVFGAKYITSKWRNNYMLLSKITQTP